MECNNNLLRAKLSDNRMRILERKRDELAFRDHGKFFELNHKGGVFTMKMKNDDVGKSLLHKKGFKKYYFLLLGKKLYFLGTEIYF